MLMATKLDRSVTYHEGGPIHKITWPFDHMVFQVKNDKLKTPYVDY